MLAATLELERKRDYLRGLDKGREEGRSALQKTIVDLLNFHFALTPEAQLLFTQQLETIENLAALNEIINGLLNREITLYKVQTLITLYVDQEKEAKSKKDSMLSMAASVSV